MRHETRGRLTRRGRRVYDGCRTPAKSRSPRRRGVLAASLVASLLLFGCSRAPEIARLEWVTMGTVAAVQVRGGTSAELETAVAETKSVFARIETLLNAHDPNSELCRLAPLSDDEILARCDPRVRPCYAAAFRLLRESGGAFNPRWRGPKTLDLGAIAKGFAVDAATHVDAPVGAFRRKAHGHGLSALLDLGGNLRSAGGTWRIGVAASGETLALTNGMACATSAEYFRGKHIRDGRTGLVVTNGLVSVTVVHPSSAMLADGLSTTLFILGRDAGERFLREHYPEARAIWVEGPAAND